jgi:Tetracyclin repressor-like, C-terminal domain
VNLFVGGYATISPNLVCIMVAGRGAAQNIVALDRMVAAGVLPKERRLGAEFLAWSTVHGFAMLVIDGPLNGFARTQIDALGQRAVAMVEKGL